MNEDSVIEDAINYMKLLKDRATMLEEQLKNESKEEPIVYVDRAWLLHNDDGTSSSRFYHESSYQTKQDLPEIEAKAQEKDVVIKVHCENQKGYPAIVLGEIEKLHLNVENISALPFGDYFLNITITAKMGDEFFMTIKELKRTLRQALLRLM